MKSWLAEFLKKYMKAEKKRKKHKHITNNLDKYYIDVNGNFCYDDPDTRETGPDNYYIFQDSLNKDDYEKIRDKIFWKKIELENWEVWGQMRLEDGVSENMEKITHLFIFFLICVVSYYFYHYILLYPQIKIYA